MMKEYEIVIQIFNACAGGSRPDTRIEEVEINDADEYMKSKYPADYEKITKEVLSNGDIQYVLDTGSMTYKYTFTEF